jgi:hypothetical protein
MKTYSVCTKVKKEGGQYWITNWHKTFNLEDIDFNKVDEFCINNGYVAYGYMYGEKSNSLRSSKCRTILKTFNGYDPNIDGLFIDGKWLK